MALSNFLIALLSLKLHNVAAVARSQHERVEKSISLDCPLPETSMSVSPPRENLVLSSDSFRWFGVCSQAGMTIGSIIVTGLLVSNTLSASDDENGEG